MSSENRAFTRGLVPEIKHFIVIQKQMASEAYILKFQDLLSSVILNIAQTKKVCKAKNQLTVSR